MLDGQDFLRFLLNVPTLEKLRVQQCPECRGRLRISFVKPVGEQGTLETSCYDCTYFDELQEVENAPPWASGKERTTLVTNKKTEDA